MISLKKQVALCTVGTVFEWYEFSIFVSLTPIISSLFFQKSSHFAAMLSTFAIFASGYIMRPLGGLFFGHLGDILGRKYTLLLTIFLMTSATVCIGLIPIGTAFSTYILICCRLIQGFATSGEYPNGLTLLAEQQNLKSSGFITSFGIFGTGAGCFCGALAYAIALHFLGYETMLQGGWRILFLLSAPLGVLGFLLRKRIYESNEYITIKKKNLIPRSPLIKLFKNHSKTLIRMLGVSIFLNILVYFNFLYLGNYTLSIHKINTSNVASLYLLTTGIYATSVLCFGFLSDYFNKKWMLLSGCILVISFIYPLFEMTITNSLEMQFFAQGLLSLLMGIMLGPFASILANAFPAEVRCSGLSVILNFSASLFGSTAPLVCSALTKTFNTPFAPLFYIIGMGIIALSSVISIWYFQKNSIPNSLIDNATGYSAP